MSETFETFMLEIIFEYGSMCRMMFRSKVSAEKARRKISDGMSKGRLRNGDPVLTIRSDAATYSIDPGRVMSVSVLDNFKWNSMAKESQDIARLLGLIDDAPLVDKKSQVQP